MVYRKTQRGLIDPEKRGPGLYPEGPLLLDPLDPLDPIWTPPLDPLDPLDPFMDAPGPPL